MSASVSPADRLIENVPREWLGGGAPLVLDVGCHRGTFLAAMAAAFPAVHFLGIERLSERVARTNARLRRLGLANAIAVHGGGLEAVAALPPGSADAIHVLFPDPWPKRRHAPRRLVQRPFLEACVSALRPGGLFRFLTDDAAYASSVETILGTNEFPLSRASVTEIFPETEFEKKFLASGKQPFEILVMRDAGNRGHAGSAFAG